VILGCAAVSSVPTMLVPDKLPEVIIFESLNMTDDYKDILFDYLRSKSYNLTSSGYNTICFKF
jgi:hypothetical protein